MFAFRWPYDELVCLGTANFGTTTAKSPGWSLLQNIKQRFLKNLAKERREEEGVPFFDHLIRIMPMYLGI